MEITTRVYQLTEAFPSSERFGLTSQITRSAVSIPSNIAEGAGRNYNKEFNQFLGISLGSSFELETQLIIAQNLSYISKEQLDLLSHNLIEIQSMIIGLQRSINKS